MKTKQPNPYPHIKGKFGPNQAIRVNSKGDGLEYTNDPDRANMAKWIKKNEDLKKRVIRKGVS